MKQYRNTNYFVTEDGRVFRNGTERKTHLSNKGYKVVSVWIDGKVTKHNLHRIVAETYIPNPDDKCCVNHKDGNKLNNHISNLEWMTNLENRQHAVKNGLHIHGINHPNSKFTDADIIEIRKKCIPADREFGYIALSKLYQTTPKVIRNIFLRLSWKHI